jgi:NADH dehydrogenase
MTSFGSQQLAPVFVGDVAALAADSLEQDAAAEQVFENGGPEKLTMREVIHRAMDVADTHKLLLPAPAALVKVAAWPMQFLPDPPLSPGAVDFVNQPATVDVGPLLERMPRTLTRFEDGLSRYLGPRHTSVSISDASQEEAGALA